MPWARIAAINHSIMLSAKVDTKVYNVSICQNGIVIKFSNIKHIREIILLLLFCVFVYFLYGRSNRMALRSHT